MKNYLTALWLSRKIVIYVFLFFFFLSLASGGGNKGMVYSIFISFLFSFGFFNLAYIFKKLGINI